MTFANNMDRDQAPQTWGPISIHIVCYPAPMFAENWLFCMKLLEFRAYRDFVNFEIAKKLLEGTVIITYLGHPALLF